MNFKEKGGAKKALTLLMMCGLAASSQAATWYVDSSASGAQNGTSWANAWTNVDQISGVAAGDTVYISGGPSGSSQTYTLSQSWTPTGGVTGHPVTYQIGQDSAHNGTAIFNSSNSSVDWLAGALGNVVVTGDAGDGKQHFQLVDNIGGIPVNCLDASYLRVSYVNCGAQGGGFELRGVSHIEIDHCYLKKLDGFWDHAMSFVSSDTGWDQNQVHDNIFYVPHDLNSPGDGDDCVQGASNSFSFHNNTVIGYAVNPYKNSQHQDGLQPLSGSYIKVYSNYFQDIGNYGVFGDAYDGDFNHFWVYNNVIVVTDSHVSSGSPAAVAIGPDGGAYGQLGRWPIFNDVVIANNLCADNGYNHDAIDLNNNPGQSSTFTNCVVANNICLNTSGPGTENSELVSGNVTMPLSNGSGHFVSYTPNTPMPPNDFHLLSADTTFRDQGINLSSYFSTTLDGVARAASGAWDIGPYTVAGSGPQQPSAPRNLRIVQ